MMRAGYDRSGSGGVRPRYFCAAEPTYLGPEGVLVPERGRPGAGEDSRRSLTAPAGCVQWQ
jgi:hypothetical protein